MPIIFGGVRKLIGHCLIPKVPWNKTLRKYLQKEKKIIKSPLKAQEYTFLMRQFSNYNHLSNFCVFIKANVPVYLIKLRKP